MCSNHLNIQAPMIKKDGSNTKLIWIRRQQRCQQLEQLRNSMRFSNQYQIYLRVTTNSMAKGQEMTEQRLQKILKQQDLQGLYITIANGSFQDSNLLDVYGIDIIEFLKNNLSSPIGVLSLGNIVSSFDICGQVVMASSCFEELVLCLGKLTPGSQGQDPYLWTLCVLTDRHLEISQKQLESFLTVLQQIFKHNIEGKSAQNRFLIRLIKNLSEVNQVMNQDLTIYFTNYFWITKNQSNKLNIYLTCCNLITKAMFHRSTKVLLHLLAVCLKGKQHLNLQKLQINIDQVLPTPYSLLRLALEYYNEEWECMESECDFQIEGNSMRLGLHTFLLTLQHHILLQFVKQPYYYDCLFQFCRHAPIELTILKWLQFETLEALIKALTQSPKDCYQVLKIFWLLGQRISDEESERSRLFQMLKSSSYIVQRVEDVICLSGDQKITQLAEKILIFFDSQ